MEQNKLLQLLIRGLNFDLESLFPNAGNRRDNNPGYRVLGASNIDPRSVIAQDVVLHDRRECFSRSYCILCQSGVHAKLPPALTNEWKLTMKNFFLQHFPVADFAGSSSLLEDDFPFCITCSAQLDKLWTMEKEAEKHVTRFKQMKDVMVTRSAEAYLRRLESDSVRNDMASVQSYRSSGSSIDSSISDSHSIPSRSLSELSLAGPENKVQNFMKFLTASKQSNQGGFRQMPN